MFKKILIANRGEIACRIIKTARKLGIKTVAICSDPDLSSPHVNLADEYFNIRGNTSAESYLIIEKIIDVLKKSNADAVHPGYGFLSENVNFREEVQKAGKIFIGPPSQAISLMGDKIESKKLAKSAGVSVVPGGLDVIKDLKHAIKEAKKIGYPLMVKASAGGGGKGMRIAFNDGELKENFNSAVNEARSSFGDDRVFIEKFIEFPKHIEIQVLGDQFGNFIHLGERECTIQRRHQKVIEEAPSFFVDENLRNEMVSHALKLAKAVSYYSAGTVEFVVDKKKNFYFLEMNTRLQVEHPVTELITNIDIVEQMIRIAFGEKLAHKQKDIKFLGTALECRIYAEDSSKNFLPSIGRLTRYIEPSGKNVRVDSGVVEGSEISMFYDPMISKLCTYSNTRKSSIKEMINALDRYLIEGVKTNRDFLSNILQNENFEKSNYSTAFIKENYKEGYDSFNVDLQDKQKIHAVAVFVNYKYLLRAASISNQLKGFNKTVGMNWQVIDDGKIINSKISFNNFNKSYDIYIGKKYLNLKSNWNIGHPLFSAIIDNNLSYFSIKRNGPKFLINHNGSSSELLVFSKRHAELNEIMIPRKKEDLSRLLLAPMPGLLVSLLVEEKQVVDENQPLAIIEAMKMENIIRSEKKTKIKKINCSEGDSLEVDQIILEFE
ncbi:MAG: acetyl/propionyl-CoA carboxylase subunit alpha [Rickettsiales bacterium]|nr:acetyl/propionyl-CoA carboxylase subunit alpha [Rickettsiales bacterium]OUT44728.1 MAG: acetyl/propionyl-CoA carboxylase subunit alpha [Pelagibacteraceae bacterium TMED13]|tara:strand:+ start:18759 stop:20747 length:1989 start_codon:yes stop_codon:yes gene_type:complete